MSTTRCPLTQIQTVFGVIHELAQINSEQLDLHRMLVENSNNSNNTDNHDEAPAADHDAQQLQKRHDELNRLPSWIRAGQVARALLALPSSSSSDAGSCTGPFDIKNCDHVRFIAACFAACKYVGTPSIAFVTLDMISTSCCQMQTAQNNSGSSGHHNDDDNAVLKQQQERQARQMKPPANLARIFDSDDEDAAAAAAHQGGGSSYDGLPKNNGFSVSAHNSFVEAVRAAEFDMLLQCGFFSSLWL